MTSAKSGGLLLYHAGESADRGTWRWDGKTWTKLALPGVSARSVHVMAYDSRRDRTVLFGGSVRMQRLGDTWEFDGTMWRPLPSVAPTY